MPKLRVPLADAGRMLGLSPNGMRTRAKKSPDLWGLERDNTGRLWVWVDPLEIAQQNPPKPSAQPSAEPSLQTRVAVLQAQVEASERARLRAEIDAEHWRSMAQSLAARRRWRWPWQS